MTRRDDIQGLRAVAVLLVALAHAGVPSLAGGYVGVDVFFVLSGFLITGLLLAEARSSGSVSLLGFYLRRARRILPAAALTLLATDAAAYLLLNFVRARAAVHDSLYAAGFAANFRFAREGVDYFARSRPPSPLLHYWSLSVEEQFYFAWPLLLSLALFGLAHGRRRRRRGEGRLLVLIVVLTSVSLAWSIRLTETAPTAAYFSPFTRAWELGLGATIAVGASTLAALPAVVKLAAGWAGVAAVAAAAVLFSDRTPFPGSAALLPTIGTGLAIVAGIGDTPRLAVGRVLSVRPLLVVGDRSYAFYLWHWPVLILAAGYAGHDLSVGTRLGLLLGAFALSCVSYTLVENPIRHRLRSPRKTGLVVLACATAVLATAAASLAGVERAQQRFERGAAAATTGTAVRRTAAPAAPVRGALPAVVAAVEAARRGAPIPAPLVPPIGKLAGITRPYLPPADCIGHDDSSTVETRICRVGTPRSTKLIVLMGDSHALMWLPALTEMAWHDGWAVVPLLRLGCIPARWTRSETGGGCVAWYRWALDQVRRLHPRVTLLGASIDERQTPSSRAALEGVVAAADALHRIGRVVVIGDPEGQNLDPVDCLLSRRASMAKCSTTWPPVALSAYDEVARRVTRLGAGFLPTRGFVCFRGRCPVVIGHTIAWIDDNHLSSAYSAEVADAFRAAFDRVERRLERRGP